MSYVPELNYDVCDSFVITAESIEAAFVNDDPSIMNPDDLALDEDAIFAGDDDSTYEEDDTLEGQEIYNAMCRAEYDDNAMADTQKGFCCMGVFMDLGEEEYSSGFAITTYATKTSTPDSAESFSIEISEGFEVDYHWGAEAFAAAKGLAVSFAAVVSTALVFAQ